jgi:hypothetical protein
MNSVLHLPHFPDLQTWNFLLFFWNSSWF